MRHKERTVTRGCGVPNVVAAVVCGTLLLPAPLLAVWGDSEYGDIFAYRSKPKPQAKQAQQTAAKPAAPTPPVAKRKPLPVTSKAAVAAPKSYQFPDADAPLHPPAASLHNEPMFDESISTALGHYQSASQRESLLQVYEATAGEPLWHHAGGVSEDVKTVIEILAGAASHGMNPDEYHVNEILEAQQQGDMTLFDLLMTDNVLRYVTHVRDGQYRPRDVDPRWLIEKGARDDLATALLLAAAEGNVPGFMTAAAPSHAFYNHLRRELGRYSAILDSGGWPQFPAQGEPLKPGMNGAEVVTLRSRLAATDGAEPDVPQPELFDSGLELAVQRFQRRHGLNEDGVVGARTREALAVPVHNRIRQIIASMERWRWVPKDLGERHIVVNVPAFRLWLREDGEDKLTMRTIVGKTHVNQQTPSIATDMKYMVLNPNWIVPNTIVSEEMAPKASRNPGYFASKGYTVTDRQGNVVDPASVNWGQYSRSNRAPYRVVESNGARGALGTVKFIFPNKHGVYLHDTQSRSLFSKDFRAYSHGCVRIEKPAELGSALLGNNDPQEFSALIASSGKNRHINLQQSLPVYLLYMTAWADEEQAYFYDDLYSRDRQLVLAEGSKRG
jgi:L,D-transpeptidase YcbB